MRTATRMLGIGLLLGAAACRESGAANPAIVVADAQAPTGPRMVTFDVAALNRLGVKVEPAGSVGPAQTLRVPGTLDYNLDHYAEIGTLLEGRVASVSARLGDRVKKGQVLATVVVPSVANAQADFLTARASATASRKNLQREQELLSKELTTAREAEVAQSESAKGEADLAAAEARLRALQVGVPSGDSIASKAGMLLLTSPLNGVVVKRFAVLGAFVQPSQTAFAVADLSELWATLEVYESDLAYLQLGAEVDLTIDAIPGKTFAGKVALFDPQIGKASRAIRARVAVPNKDGELRPGLFVRAAVRLPAEAASGRLLIPTASLQPLGEADVVFVEKKPGSFEVRTVQVARRTNAVVEIAEGLVQGERIAVEGAFLHRGEVTRQ